MIKISISTVVDPKTFKNMINDICKIQNIHTSRNKAISQNCISHSYILFIFLFHYVNYQVYKNVLCFFCEIQSLCKNKQKILISKIFPVYINDFLASFG